MVLQGSHQVLPHQTFSYACMYCLSNIFCFKHYFFSPLAYVPATFSFNRSAYSLQSTPICFVCVCQTSLVQLQSRRYIRKCWPFFFSILLLASGVIPRDSEEVRSICAPRKRGYKIPETKNRVLLFGITNYKIWSTGRSACTPSARDTPAHTPMYCVYLLLLACLPSSHLFFRVSPFFSRVFTCNSWDVRS